jgi:hypothetical protein
LDPTSTARPSSAIVFRTVARTWLPQSLIAEELKSGHLVGNMLVEVPGTSSATRISVP